MSSTIDCKPDVAPTLVEHLRHRLEEGQFSDMVIVVGPTTFRVHKFMVGGRTSIPTDGDSITLSDIPHANEVFGKFLSFIYTDQAALDDDTVVPILRLARKYNVRLLETECFNFLINRLDKDTVCTVYEEAVESKNSTVMELCLKRIQDNPAILTSASFIALSKDNLDTIVSDDDLQASEILIFEAVVAWSKAECARRDIEDNPANQRHVLGSILLRIRFIWLSLYDIYDKVVLSELLDPGKLSELLGIKGKGIFKTQIFNVDRRCSKKKQKEYRIVRRLPEVHDYQDSVGWSCDGKFEDAISLTTDRPIALCGVGIYGPRSEPKGFYQIRLVVSKKSRTEILAERQTEMKMSRSPSPNHFTFDEPFLMKERIPYDIRLTIKGPSTLYGSTSYEWEKGPYIRQGEEHFIQSSLPRHKDSGITFQFGNSSHSPDGRTCMSEGQIPEILYSPVDKTP